MDPFATLWDRIEDPRHQMQLAVLYLVIRRDLGGVVIDRDALVALMARHHGWAPRRTRLRLDRLVDLGLVVREQGLGGDRPVYRLPA